MEKRRQLTPYGKVNTQNEWYIQERERGEEKKEKT